MLTRALAKAWAPKISVNSVAPGVIPFGEQDERIGELDREDAGVSRGDGGRDRGRGDFFPDGDEFCDGADPGGRWRSQPAIARRRRDRAKCDTFSVMRKSLTALATTLLLCLPVTAQEKVDLNVVNRIKTEAFGQNSKVMDTAFYLTDVYGPRLTGSNGVKNSRGLGSQKIDGMGPDQRERRSLGTVRARMELHPVCRHDERAGLYAADRLRASLGRREPKVKLQAKR